MFTRNLPFAPVGRVAWDGLWEHREVCCCVAWVDCNIVFAKRLVCRCVACGLVLRYSWLKVAFGLLLERAVVSVAVKRICRSLTCVSLDLNFGIPLRLPADQWSREVHA